MWTKEQRKESLERALKKWYINQDFFIEMKDNNYLSTIKVTKKLAINK